MLYKYLGYKNLHDIFMELSYQSKFSEFRKWVECQPLKLQFRKICLLLSFVHMSLIFGIFILIFKTVFKISGFIEIWRSRIQLPVFEVIRNFYVNFSIEICEIFWRLLPSLNFITDISGVCEISVSRNTYLLYF